MEGLESESIVTGTSYHDDLSNMDEDTRGGGDYTIVEGGDGDHSNTADNLMMLESQTMSTSQFQVCHSIDHILLLFLIGVGSTCTFCKKN